MNYKEFYQSFGPKDFPFDTFTTEDEVEVAKKIFVAQGDYDPTSEAFKKGRNIIISGQRGIRKTAILDDFNRYLQHKKKPFTITTDFSEIPQIPSDETICRLIISNFIVELLS